MNCLLKLRAHKWRLNFSDVLHNLAWVKCDECGRENTWRYDDWARHDINEAFSFAMSGLSPQDPGAIQRLSDNPNTGFRA